MGGWDEEQPVSALSAHPPLPTPGPEGVPAPRGQLRAEAHRGQTYTWPSAQGRGHTESITSVRALAWDFILNFLALGLVAFGCVGELCCAVTEAAPCPVLSSTSSSVSGMMFGGGGFLGGKLDS